MSYNNFLQNVNQVCSSARYSLFSTSISINLWICILILLAHRQTDKAWTEDWCWEARDPNGRANLQRNKVYMIWVFRWMDKLTTPALSKISWNRELLLLIRWLCLQRLFSHISCDLLAVVSYAIKYWYWYNLPDNNKNKLIFHTSNPLTFFVWNVKLRT